MKTIGRIIRRIKFYLIIRDKLLRMIIITTSERNRFKDALKFNPEDVKYLESRIEIKNEVLYQLRNLL